MSIQPSAGESAVAIDPQGRTFFVWSEPRPSLHSDKALRTRPRAADGTFGAYRSISAGRDYVLDQQVAVDTRGNALVVWSGGANEFDPVIQARFRTAAGVFGPIQTLSACVGECAHFTAVLWTGAQERTRTFTPRGTRT